MGCLKSKSKNYFIKDTKLEFADKRSQITRLQNILKKINREYKKLQKTHLTNNSMRIKKRACYLAQMTIFIKWTIRIVEVNQEDRKIDFIIDEADKLLDANVEDEFILNSFENKIKHLINIKK